MDNYRVPIDSRKEIVMTINTPTTSTTTIPYGYKAALLSILINHMVNELDPTRVWSIVEHAMTDMSKVDPELNTQVVNIVRNIYRDKTAPTNSTTTPTTSTTDSDKESNLKGGDATRKEATTMANNINTTVPTTSTKSEAGELIASFIEDSLGNTLPNEYKIINRIAEAIPIISKAVESALSIAMIRIILTGNHPQSLKFEDGDTVSNVKALIRALTNKDKVTISDLVKILKYGSYDCLIDEEARIAATLIYINLYK